MKKIILSLAVFVSCGVSFVLLGCQNDEAEMDSKEKVDLLMAKSEEFAKKYGVDVSLNKDYVKAHADEMTIEGMEADYRGFAELKAKSQKNQALNVQKTVPTKKKSKKSFLVRRKVETETITPDMFKKSGTIESSNTIDNLCCGSEMHYSVKAEWFTDNGTINVTLTSINVNCAGLMCHRMGHGCTACKYENVSGVRFYAQGGVLNDVIKFSGSASIGNISVCQYTFKNVVAYVVYNEEAGGGDISLSFFK